jgi:hypothetical protein
MIGCWLAGAYFQCGETSMSDRAKRLSYEAAIAIAGMLPVALLAYVLFQ